MFEFDFTQNLYVKETLKRPNHTNQTFIFEIGSQNLVDNFGF